MESAPAEVTEAMILAVAILSASYVFIFTEIVHRTIAALIGAVVMVGLGMWAGFYSQEAAIRAIDANTILLLAGMMMMVAMLKRTGGFEYLAVRIAKAATGSPRRLLVYLTLAVSVISMVLDNVTTVIVFAPLTVLICRILAMNPMPFLMGEAMLSNVGGIATLVGDPPNIMIGSAGRIDFNTFLFHMGPVVALVWIVVVVLILYQFRGLLAPSARSRGRIELDLDEKRAIHDPVGLRRTLIGLGVIVALFFIHHLFHLYPSYVALIGVALTLALVRPDPDELLKEVEWPVLLFFSALFVIVGGVEGSGLLHLLGGKLALVSGEPEQLLLTCLLLLWVSAVLSAIVDNIPFTVTMIPIVLGLEAEGVNITPLWWALALGVGLGGNGCHIGATANIICVAESERSGLPGARITPGIWLHNGLPVMLISLVIASLVFAIFFDFFS
jgi:Na+/H+ antiporter NhaD/arsenite permease-like protein